MADERRHDIDALRVLAVLVLLVYHCTRPFDAETWHIKDADRSLGLMLFGNVFTPWRLPLLFAVSGAGTWFALRRRSASAYATDRLRRLLVPLVVGMLVVVPPQVYVERVSVGMPDRMSPIDFHGSFLAFYPRVFDGVYPGGNFSWHHLWFLVYLLVFSLVTLPLLFWLRRPAGRRVIERLAALSERPGAILLGALPLAVVHVALRGRFPPTLALVGDWWNLTHYGLLFLLGYVIVADPRFGAAFERHRRVALALFALVTPLRLALVAAAFAPPAYSAGYTLGLTLRALMEWCALVAVLGYGRRWLNQPSRILTWAAARVYPFYIWHQTVIVVLAVWVLAWPAAVAAKFLALVALSLLGSVALCELVGATRLTRLLFGMKP